MHPLDHPIWTALTSRQQGLAEGGALARRYPPDIGPFAAIADTSPQSFAATVTGTDGSTANATFAIGNATTLFGSGNNAFSNLAGPSSSYFDWGLPFFFGRRIFTAIESRVTPAGNGPYYAF